MDIKKSFQDILKIASVTDQGREEEACIYIERILQEEGIQTKRISKVTGRPNLLAIIKASNPTEAPLVLISHIDVVDGQPSEWTYPMFGGEIQRGRIWGRGTLDTKHLTMMELNAFIQLKGQESRLTRDVIFLATIDEEAGSSYGMEYVKQMCPKLFQDAIVLNEGGGFPLMINAKPYMMVTVGEKGVCKVRLWADGKGGHASAPGDNQAMLKLAGGLKAIFQGKEKLPIKKRKVYEKMRGILGQEPIDNDLARDLLAYAGANDIIAKNYKIGERTNVIPSRAEIILEFRVLPGISQEDILAYLESQLQESQVAYEVLSYEEGFENDLEDKKVKDFLESMEKVCRHQGFEVEVLPMLALGRTDGRFFGPSKSCVFGFSPVLMGDAFDVILPKVHGKDESILEESFSFGCRVLEEWIQTTTMPEGGKQ